MVIVFGEVLFGLVHELIELQLEAFFSLRLLISFIVFLLDWSLHALLVLCPPSLLLLVLLGLFLARSSCLCLFSLPLRRDLLRLLLQVLVKLMHDFAAHICVETTQIILVDAELFKIVLKQLLFVNARAFLFLLLDFFIAADLPQRLLYELLAF